MSNQLRNSSQTPRHSPSLAFDPCELRRDSVVSGRDVARSRTRSLRQIPVLFPSTNRSNGFLVVGQGVPRSKVHSLAVSEPPANVRTIGALDAADPPDVQSEQPTICASAYSR